MSNHDGELEIVLHSPPAEAEAVLPRPAAPELVIQAKGLPDPDLPAVYLNVQAVAELLRHLPTGHVESGGLIVGSRGRDAEGAYVRIEGAVPARVAEGGPTHLKLTHAAWGALLDEKQARCPDLQIVGWYHTHPGLGVFLSAADMFIQQHFFTDMLALVIDAGRLRDRFTWGIFVTQGDEVRALRGCYIYGQAGLDVSELEQVLEDYRPGRRWDDGYD